MKMPRVVYRARVSKDRGKWEVLVVKVSRSEIALVREVWHPAWPDALDCALRETGVG